jgi:hypothetical protein
MSASSPTLLEGLGELGVETLMRALTDQGAISRACLADFGDGEEMWLVFDSYATVGDVSRVSKTQDSKLPPKSSAAVYLYFYAEKLWFSVIYKFKCLSSTNRTAVMSRSVPTDYCKSELASLVRLLCI